MSNNTTARAGAGKVVTKITSRPFVSRQYGLNDPNDPFTKAKVKKELDDRLSGITYPDQGASSLCGPACFFYCLLIDNPIIYKQAIWELWRNGETNIEDLNIKPSEQAKNPKDLFDASDVLRIPAIDWMSLASLRDSANAIMSYNSPFDQTSGITLPGEIIGWFKKAGYRHIVTLVVDSFSNLNKINSFQKLPDYHIISLVNSGFISNQNLPKVNHPNHWIVWTDILKKTNGSKLDNSIKGDDPISLKIFTWGSINKSLKTNLTFKEFQKYHFEAIIIGK